MRIGKGTGRTARWLLAVVMAFGASVAMAQITGTKHNLGSTSTAGNNKVSNTGEICVFCHTPHAADSFTGAPLWNKKISTTTTYTVYPTSSTMDAERATGGLGTASIGSVSLACLSCHDGTQAMDNILNAPGSGGYSASGTNGVLTGLGWTWTGSGVDTATGKMTNAATTLAMLGTDLSNDHPIGMQYCGGGPTKAAPTAACVDGDFYAPQSNTGATSFWVDTSVGTAGTRQKTDMILYNRSFATAGEGPSVECASCHDPHTANTTFLRIANTGSAVCLACHNK